MWESGVTKETYGKATFIQKLAFKKWILANSDLLPSVSQGSAVAQW